MTATQRTVVGAAATVRWQPTDGYGTAAAPAGAVTVTATRSDGTAVLAEGTATIGDGSAERTAVIPAGDLLQPDLLTITWSDTDIGVRAITTVEVVGAWWASIAEIRASDASLAVADVYPDATLTRVRLETEDEFEGPGALGESWRPRLSVVTATADGPVLDVGLSPLRSIRWARTAAGATVDVSAVTVEPDFARARRAAGWPTGPLTVGVEHGHSAIPADLRRAFTWRCRTRANLALTVPQWATAIAAGDQTFRLAAPSGRGGWITGDRDVDAILTRIRDERRMVIL